MLLICDRVWRRIKSIHNQKENAEGNVQKDYYCQNYFAGSYYYAQNSWQWLKKKLFVTHNRERLRLVQFYSSKRRSTSRPRN